MEKPKNRRIVEVLAAGALIAGAAGADAREQKVGRAPAAKVESKEGAEKGHESILSETKDLIDKIPKSTLDSQKQKGESDRALRQRFHKELLKAIAFSDAEVASHRFKNEAREKDYFEACYDKARWKEIQTYSLKASEKTGVPQELLISMGFIESRFKPMLSRTDTKVYGPLQMTLNAGKKAARESKAIYGTEIKVDKKEDLMDIKNGLMLAAIHLKNLGEKYGQWGLAVAAYSSGSGALDKKLMSEFPNVDFGASDREEMKTAASKARKAKKTMGTLGIVKRSGKITSQQTKAYDKARADLSAARKQYRESEKLWRSKLEKMPQTLKDLGINISTLFNRIRGRGDKIPHSLTYPLSLDSISSKAKNHAEKNQG
jgi:hypothetical protein